MSTRIVSCIVVLLSAISALAGELGTWQTFAPMPAGRQEVGVALVDGSIYVIGGFRNGVSVNTVERYDPATDEWESVAPLPAADPLNHVGAVGVDGKLYVVGGLQQNFQAVGSVFVFDPVAGEWDSVAPMPQPRGAMGLAVIDGLIYAAGGLPAVRNRQFTVYDPLADQWTTLASMPTGRDHLAAVAIDGRFYAFSGRAGGVLQSATEMFDPISGQWSGLASIPTARGGIAAAAIDRRAVVFGGEGNDAPGSGGVFDEVEEYDTVTEQWRALAPMPEGRHGIGAALAGGLVFIPGGSPLQGLGQSVRNDGFTPPALDTDGDGINDAVDNCLSVGNSNQLDSDGDGFGNPCDADLDGDCMINFIDLALIKTVFFEQGDSPADLNTDQVVDFLDLALMKAVFFSTPGPSAIADCAVR